MVLVGDAFLPAHCGNPGRRRIEGAHRRGQCGFMAGYIQLDADSSGECCVLTVLFCHRQANMERRRGHSSPSLKVRVCWTRVS